MPLTVFTLVLLFALEEDVLKEVIYKSPSLQVFEDKIVRSGGSFSCECTGKPFIVSDFNSWLLNFTEVFKTNKDALCQPFVHNPPHPVGCEDIIRLPETVLQIIDICTLGKELLSGRNGLLQLIGNTRFNSPKLLTRGELDTEVLHALACFWAGGRAGARASGRAGARARGHVCQSRCL